MTPSDETKKLKMVMLKAKGNEKRKFQLCSQMYSSWSEIFVFLMDSL